MAGTAALVAALLLLLLSGPSTTPAPRTGSSDGTVMGQGPGPALDCGAIIITFDGIVMRHRATPALDCRAVDVHGETSDFIGAARLDGFDFSIKGKGGIMTWVMAAAMALSWISVGIKWKTPSKVMSLRLLGWNGNIIFTALLVASAMHIATGETVTVPVAFDLNVFEPVFTDFRSEVVINRPLVGGHYITPIEQFLRKGMAKAPLKWIRVDCVGEVGKEISLYIRGDNMYLLASANGRGVIRYMGKENDVLFDGAKPYPFSEDYTSLLGKADTGETDTVNLLMELPLGRSAALTAVTTLADYDENSPPGPAGRAHATLSIILCESQRIKSIGDKLRKNWEHTTYLTRDEATDMLIWSKYSRKWCDQNLGREDTALNQKLINREMYSLDKINNTIDLVKRPRTDRGRCAV